MSPRRLALLVTAAALSVGAAGAFSVGPSLELRIAELAARLVGTPTSPPATATSRPLPTAIAVAALGDLPVRQAEAGSAGAAFGRIRQLSFDGCCAAAWWAADSQALHVLDRPTGAAQTGIYALDLWPPGALPRMVDTRTDMIDSGTRLLVRPAGEYSIVKDVETGLEWPLPTDGNPVRLSPDGQRAVWWDAAGGRAQVDGLGRVYASGIDGRDPREIGALWGIDVIGFQPDGRHVLVLGRPMRDRPLYVLSRLDTDSGAMQELARGLWLSNVLLSPGGSWLAYTVSLDVDQPEANGVWVAPTTPGLAPPRRLEVHGAYRWRDDARLVYVPMLPGAGAHALVELDAAQFSSSLLFDPAELPIRIAGNDWSIAPDGSKLAFRSADDRNLWVVELPR
ncbi:MAG: hypothetical protein H6648_04320 [Caldilineae bacterium]|nr:hypothetical protein [Chloroflexota bacterium]MCB9176363.1 hypothetical protein [Caldilineae bacterium]